MRHDNRSDVLASNEGPICVRGLDDKIEGWTAAGFKKTILADGAGRTRKRKLERVWS